MTGRRFTVSRSIGHDGLVNGRHRGIPRGIETGDPLKELALLEPRCADDARAGFDAREQRAHESVNMEERHDVEAAIRRCQREMLRDGARRGEQVAVRERHDLRLPRRARCMQHECDIVRFDAALSRSACRA